jgi:hypothetical protein
MKFVNPLFTLISILPLYCVAQTDCDTLPFIYTQSHMQRDGNYYYIDGIPKHHPTEYKVDSVNTIFKGKRYLTTCDEVYYCYEYNLLGNLKYEGFNKRVEHADTIKRFLRKPKIEKNSIELKDGIWKEYDSNGNLISEICYTDNIICQDCDCRRLK